MTTMPTVMHDGPYSYVVFSSDRGEPAHIHVKQDRPLVKYWLDPIGLTKNRGFAEPELDDIKRLIEKHQPELWKAWHEHFAP